MAIEGRLQDRRMVKQCIIFMSIVLAILIPVSFSTEDRFVTIERVDTRQSISGYDNHISTYYTHYVYTDMGMYVVEEKGIFAHPEILPDLQVGRKVTITTIMYSIPVLGVYPQIISVR